MIVVKSNISLLQRNMQQINSKETFFLQHKLLVFKLIIYFFLDQLIPKFFLQQPLGQVNKLNIATKNPATKIKSCVESPVIISEKPQNILLPNIKHKKQKGQANRFAISTYLNESTSNKYYFTHSYRPKHYKIKISGLNSNHHRIIHHNDTQRKKRNINQPKGNLNKNSKIGAM